MAAPVYDAVVLFGDSLTQAGWADNAFSERLADAYSRKLDVLNRGLAGYTTDWALPVLKKARRLGFPDTPINQANQCLDGQGRAPKTRMIVIWFGANDSCLESSPQHVPIARFLDNLKEMVQLVRDADETTKIILATPPPVYVQQRWEDISSRNPALPMDRSFETTKLYADGVRKVGAESKVPVMDVWSAIWKSSGEVEEGLRRFLSDGLHLTSAGYEIVYDALLDTIREWYSELGPDAVEYLYPRWDVLARGS